MLVRHPAASEGSDEQKGQLQDRSSRFSWLMTTLAAQCLSTKESCQGVHIQIA